MVSALLRIAGVGTLWNISTCGHLAGQSWSLIAYFDWGSAGHSFLLSMDVLLGALLSIHALVWVQLGTQSLIGIFLMRHSCFWYEF